MSNRFIIPWSRLSSMVRGIRSIFQGADAQLLSAFNAAVDRDCAAVNVTQFDKNIRALCEPSGEPAWPLFNTISALLLGSPAATRKVILDQARIDTGAPHEVLSLDAEGGWRVGWLLADNPKTEEDVVTVEWYRPDEPERTPITPQPMIDYIGGCVGLYRAGLILPALATLTMAYESALWDALAAGGVSRSIKRRTYIPSKWKLKKVSDKLVVEIVGADANIADLVNNPGVVFEEVDVRLNSIASEKSPKDEIVIKVTGATSPYLASSTVETEDESPGRGLSAAVQMARANNIQAIKTVVEQLDKTFIAIRNSLVHFPANGLLNPPIPVWGRKTAIADIATLASDQRLFVSLLTAVLGVINTTYSDRAPSTTVSNVAPATPSVQPVAPTHT